MSKQSRKNTTPSQYLFNGRVIRWRGPGYYVLAHGEWVKETSYSQVVRLEADGFKVVCLTGPAKKGIVIK